MAVSGSQGTAFGYSVTVPAVSYTAIGNITNISGPDTDTEMLDTTALDTSGAYRTYVPSFLEPGEFSIDMLVDTSDTAFQTLWTNWASQTLMGFELTYPNDDTTEFEGYLMSAPNLSAGVGELMTATINIKITGAITNTFA